MRSLYGDLSYCNILGGYQGASIIPLPLVFSYFNFITFIWIYIVSDSLYHRCVKKHLHVLVAMYLCSMES